MARQAKGKVTRRIIEHIDDGDEEQREEGRDSFFDPAEESFSQFRSKFGTEGVLVKIYRRTPRGVQYCFSGVPSEIDEEVVRLYHAKQPYASEEGQYAARCYVNGEARDSFPILIGPQIASPGVEGVHGGMAGQSEIVKLLIAQNERLEARLSQIGNVEREPLGSLADALVKLESLRPKTDLPIDTIMKAVELGKQLNGGGEGGSEWGPLIKEALSALGPAIAPLLSGLVNRQPQAPAAPALPEGGNGMQTDDVMLKTAFAFLKRKCLAGSDPGLYIDIIVDNRDEPTYQKLIHAVLTREFSAFTAIDPEISKPPYVEFFKFIYDGLRSIASGQDQVATDTTGKSGDAGHANGDGKSRKEGGKKS